MAAPAEVIHTEPIQEERYAHSNSKLRVMGALAVDKEVSLEAIPVVGQAYADYVSGVREMIRSDKEFKNRLDIDDKRDHDIVDGQARDLDGKPMVKVVENGWRSSESKARLRPEFRFQVLRDAGDVHTAKTADALKPGESYVTVSMAPKEGLQEHPEIYKDELGYSEDLMYVQWYAKGVDKMTAGSCSIEIRDEAALLEVLAEEGIVIPPGESSNTWIMHGMKRESTAGQTEKRVLNLRQKVYERQAMPTQRHSVSEYVANNSDIMESIFKAYYPGLAKAVNAKHNNETLQGLANALLKTDLTNMEQEARAVLIQVANSSKFNDELGNTMDAVIRYAAVEELRKGLAVFIAGSRQTPATSPGDLLLIERSDAIAAMHPAMLNQRMANNVQSGVQEGRSYGGCAGQIKLSKDSGLGNELSGYMTNGDSQQSAYGGRSRPCRSIKNGMNTTCPYCKQKVKTIVPKEGGEVYCSNNKCARAAARHLIKKMMPGNEKQKTWS
ncbi:hypothetical protein COY17_00975 [Candidatus Saccharibacteria bacterium CG_4_10_14_0_2_um_filter_52_9]|nr:MAG: hypothetical protein COY17_00975 [Candidatus Saccharibacteria bacterium CG_4_10_14_0_2_um_filter_52_9]